MRTTMAENFPSLHAEATAEQIVQAGLSAANGPVALACSFSAEDVAALHLALQVSPEIGVFALDTGRLPEETFRVADAVARRLEVRIRWLFPLAEKLETLTGQQGVYSFYESVGARRECCRVRKVEPLKRALSGLGGWITGLRREQSVTREALAPLERDEAHGGIVKINPLAEWSWEAVLEYLEAHNLPLHSLHGKGYPSIGCAPCTRAVRPGEHPRAGRWWWEDPDKKECGLHVT